MYCMKIYALLIINVIVVGVDIELWGHEHIYERYWPLYDFKVVTSFSFKLFPSPLTPPPLYRHTHHLLSFSHPPPTHTPHVW